MCSERALVRVPEGASLQHSPSVWTHHGRPPSVRNERLSSDNCRGKGCIPGPSSHPFHVPVKHLVNQALVVRALEGWVLWAVHMELITAAPTEWLAQPGPGVGG